MTEDESELLDGLFGMLDEIKELACKKCGKTGDTMPCIKCDIFICGECGTDVGFCKSCADEYYDSKN